MLTRADKVRRIVFTVVMVAALGFLLSKAISGGFQPITQACKVECCDAGDCARDETLRAVLPVGGNGARNPTDVSNFDPARVDIGDTTAMTVVNQLFDGLVTFDKHLQVEPWGAKSWTISPDGLTYTFTLQPNPKFSDGTAVKASDYAWSLNRSIDPCLGESSNAAYWMTLKDATSFHGEACSTGQPGGAIKTLVGRAIVPDDSANTLTIKLAHPAGYFLAALAYPWAFVIDQKEVTGDHLGRDGRWLDNLVGGSKHHENGFDFLGQGTSGMFYLSNWDHSGSMVLKQNPNWWGSKPNFTEVDYTFASTIDSPNAAFDTFKANPSLGFTTMLPDTPDTPVTSLKNQAYYRAQPALLHSWLTFNRGQAPFNDINARKAFCLAINREQLNQQLYQGANNPTWDIIPPELLSYSGLVKGIDNAPVTGNVALARQYWQKYLAAHGGQAPSLVLYAPDPQSQRGQLTTRLRALWEQTLGLSIRLDDSMSHPLTTTPSPVYVVPTVGTAAYPDPQSFMSQAVLWNGQPTSTPADALIRRADALPYMDAWSYHQAEQSLIDNAIVCPLVRYVNHYAVRSWVKGSFDEDARGLFSNDAWRSGYIVKH